MVFITDSEQTSGGSKTKKLRNRQTIVDELKKKRLAKKHWLKDQIENHDRMDLLMTEVLGYQIKDFHWAMYLGIKFNSLVIPNQVDGKDQRWNLTLAPRGHGKSTILNISRCVLKIIQNPDIRILIASKTDDNAVTFLSEIKQKLKRKEFVALFGNHIGTIWNDGNIRVAPRKSDAKEDTITTMGVGGSPASKHFDLIIGDDLVDEENSRTEGQREKIRTWFLKVLLPCLEPDGGEMSLIGTRYYPEDLWGYLQHNILCKKTKKGKIKKRYYQVYPALIEIKKLLKRNTPESKKYLALWPEKASVRYLLRLRKIMGRIIFNAQMQNDVEGMKGKIFKIDWFKWYRLEDINVSKLIKIQGADLAIKQSDDADKFAHITIGIDKKTKNIYVLSYHNAVTHYTDQKAIIKREFDRYDPIKLGIEANGYQRALIQDMQTDEKLANIRAVPVFTDKDKTVRAWKLSAYFERGQIYFLEGMHDLMEHLLKMPSGRFKDLFDALDIAVNLAFGGSKKTRDEEPGLI